MSLFQKPVVGIPASVLEITSNKYLANASGKRNSDGLFEFSDCIPLIIPPLGKNCDFNQLLDHFDGIFLTGGRANIEPHHYGGKPFPPDEPIDPDRDNTVIPLIRKAVEREMPIFGVCRGIQELNVALGGTLHYRINELPGKNDHRMPQGDNIPQEEIFKLRHLVSLSSDGLFQKLIKLDKFKVNSLHGQGIDKLSHLFEVEAVTIDDNVIEGIRLKDDPGFTVGVQWHAEWKPNLEENRLSRKLFEEFGKAARKYSRKKG